MDGSGWSNLHEKRGEGLVRCFNERRIALKWLVMINLGFSKSFVNVLKKIVFFCGLLLIVF